MYAFTVELSDRPGALAEVCAPIAERGVNVMLCGISSAGRGVVGIVADAEGTVREALTAAGVEFEGRPALRIRLPNRPGAAVELSQALGDAGINMTCLVPVVISADEAELAVCVDDEEGAKRALGDRVVS